MSISWTKATLTHYVLLGYERKDVKCIEEKVSGKERKNIWKAVYFRQADVICPRERSLVFTKYRKHRPFSVFKGFHVHIFTFSKVQRFWESHKNVLNRPYGFEIYLVNVKTIRTIAQIFVAFSEKLNFIWFVCQSETFLEYDDVCDQA